MFRAQGLTERFAPNRNLTLPARPALAADLIPLRLPRGAIAYLGGSAPVLLNGRSVSELLPGLLPLLRGDLDAGAVTAHVGPALKPAVDDLLRFLFARGLLVDHQDQPRQDSAAMRSHALFFERYCSELTLANGARPAQQLRDGQVLLIEATGADDALTPLKDALTALGLHVLTAPVEGILSLPPAAADAPTIAVVTPATMTALTADQTAHAARLGWRWLPLAAAHDGGLLAGPVLRDGVAPCPDCLNASADTRVPPASSDPALWIAAAHLVLMALADATTSHWGINRLRLDAATLDWRSEGHARRPACRRCGCGAHSAPDAAGAGFIAAYHLNTQDPPLRTSARQHLVSYEPAQVDKVRGAAKPYNDTHWRWDKAAYGNTDLAARLLTLAGQCVLWRQAAGQVPVRPVPSAGNLASQSLYLVQLQSGDAHAGVHYLHPDGRAFRVADLAQAQASGIAGWLGGASAGLVATAAIARLESKYGHKAYRFAHYDSGVLLSALQMLARDQSAALLSSADLDDGAMDTLLGLDGCTELVCWLATLASVSPPPAAAPATAAVIDTDEGITS